MPLCAYDLDGILLDHLWYPEKTGGNKLIANSITSYLIKIRQVLTAHEKNKILLSAVLLPRTFSDPFEHGQDVTAMTSYLNMVIPLTFTHRYLENPVWVGEQIKNFHARLVHGCRIWPGLQLLDDDKNLMTPLEMQQIVDFAIHNGASGIVLYGYPFIDWQWEQVKEWKNSTGHITISESLR